MLKKISKPAVNFCSGFFCPYNSFIFIKNNSGLYKYIIVPLVVNILVFSLVVYWGFAGFYGFVMSRLPQGDAWYWIIINYLLVVVAILVVLVMVFFSFAAIGSLIASPFNDILSEKTEQIVTGITVDEPFSWSGILGDARRAIGIELKKISIFLVGMLIILLMHLLPVIGVLIYPILAIVWTMLFLVAEYTGYVFSRKKMDFKSQRQVILKYPALMAGFGVGLFCLLAVPFTQFLCIPLGVVGAVRLLHEAGELVEDK